jgi:hypothetical protein
MNNNYEEYNYPMDNNGNKDNTGNNGNNDLTLNQLIENYQINRNKDVYLKNDANPILLDDRTMFNKFSNSNDSEIDFNVNNDKFNFRSVHIYNNKKNLINNPYIVKNNGDNNNNGCIIKANNDDNGYHGYQEVCDGAGAGVGSGAGSGAGSCVGSSSFDQAYQRDFSNSSKSNNVISIGIITDFLNLTATPNATHNATHNASHNTTHNTTISPQLLSYLIYSIILLSKNPSTDALLEIYNFKSKDIAISEMKELSDVVNKYGNVSYVIPGTAGTAGNTTFINKIKDIFNIGITHYNQEQDKEQRFIIYANFDFKLGIPLYYNPEIIKYKNKNFIKMSNVILSYNHLPQENIGCIEVLMHTYKLGFIFNKGNDVNININSEGALKVIMQNKDYSIMSTTMLIPNISTNIKDLYYNISKLSNLHLGELVNGVMLKPNIFLNTSLEMDIIPVEKNNVNTCKKVISKSVINFKHYYYYIKDDKNNIIYCGVYNEL